MVVIRHHVTLLLDALELLEQGLRIGMQRQKLVLMVCLINRLGNFDAAFDRRTHRRNGSCSHLYLVLTPRLIYYRNHDEILYRDVAFLELVLAYAWANSMHELTIE